MEKVIYIGVFFDLEAVKSAVKQNGGVALEKEISLPHITLAFRPSDVELQKLQPLLNKEVEVKLDEFAHNDRNAGFRVSIVAPDGIVENFLKGKIPHITTSVGKDGRPVDTPKLFDGSFEGVNFVQVDSQTIIGRIGVFCSDGQVYYERRKYMKRIEKNVENQMLSEMVPFAGTYSKLGSKFGGLGVSTQKLMERRLFQTQYGVLCLEVYNNSWKMLNNGMNYNESHVINNGTNVYYFRINDIRFDKALKASTHPSRFENGEIAKFGYYHGEYVFNVFLDDYSLSIEAVEELIEQFLAALD
mgnify:CR=1 FL=1